MLGVAVNSLAGAKNVNQIYSFVQPHGHPMTQFDDFTPTSYETSQVKVAAEH
jgi:hypothetical protein